MLNKLIRPNRFYRGVAIFFLVFTAFDLTFLPDCNEDGPALPSISQKADRDNGFAASFESPSSDQPDHHSVPGAEDHDCFCCCTHLIPATRISLSDLPFSTEAVPRNLINLPVAPSQATDHPPRLA